MTTTPTPAFAKKQYEKLVAVFASIPLPAKKKRAALIRSIADAFADMLAADNPKFNRKLFFKRIEELCAERLNKEAEDEL